MNKDDLTYTSNEFGFKIFFKHVLVYEKTTDWSYRSKRDFDYWSEQAKIKIEKITEYMCPTIEAKINNIDKGSALCTKK